MLQNGDPERRPSTICLLIYLYLARRRSAPQHRLVTQSTSSTRRRSAPQHLQQAQYSPPLLPPRSPRRHAHSQHTSNHLLSDDDFLSESSQDDQSDDQLKADYDLISERSNSSLNSDDLYMLVDPVIRPRRHVRADSDDNDSASVPNQLGDSNTLPIPLSDDLRTSDQPHTDPRGDSEPPARLLLNHMLCQDDPFAFNSDEDQQQREREMQAREMDRAIDQYNVEDREQSEAFRESQRDTTMQVTQQEDQASRIKQGRKRWHLMDRSDQRPPTHQLVRPNTEITRRGIQALRAPRDLGSSDPLSQAIV